MNNTDKPMKLIHEFPKGEHVVNMAEYNGFLVVCTNNRVYKLDKDGVITPILIEAES